jgi:hypothetical protein
LLDALRRGDQTPASAYRSTDCDTGGTSQVRRAERGHGRSRAPTDCDTGGTAHLGVMPELIEDARRSGATDADLEPPFRSAEAYLGTWYRAERRTAELSAER